MGKFKNNAIILTSIKGERGLPGLPGPAGQAVYTGIGDPNLLTFTYPDYSADPPSYVRGVETVYYQDTLSGEVWSMAYTDGVQDTSVWVNTGVVLKGTKGDTGSSAYNKIDVIFTTNTYGVFQPASGTDEWICNVIFPGLTVAPNFSTVKLLVKVSSDTVADFTLKDSSDNIIATGTAVNTSLGILNMAVSPGTFPSTLDVLTLSVTTIYSGGTFGTEKAHISYLSIT